MCDSDLPLFAWQPPKKIVVFPLANRVGKVRDVARKLIDKTTERGANHYRRQVEEPIVLHLRACELDEYEIGQQLTIFWHQVEIEMTRLAYRSGGLA